MADQDLQQPTQQGPPPFMQAQMGGAPPMSGGVLPPTNPLDATTGDPMQQALLQSTQIGQKGIQARETAAMGPEMGGRLPQLIQQQQELSGNLAFHPSFRHGGGAGGFFHNLGQALLTIGAASVPGQSVQNVVYSKPRQEYAGLSEQIKSLQEQQKLTQETEPALAGMVYHPITAAASLSRAQSYAQYISDRHGERLTSLAQGWSKLDKTQQQIELKKWYQQAYLDAFNKRTAVGEEVGMARVGAMQDIAGAIQSNEIVQKSPIKAQIMDFLGISPDVQVPAGAATQPTKPGHPAQERRAPSTKGGTVRYQSGGRTYNIPANMEQEFLKDHPDARRQ